MNRPNASSPRPISSGCWCARAAAALRRVRFLTRDGVFGRGLAGRFFRAMSATSTAGPPTLPGYPSEEMRSTSSRMNASASMSDADVRVRLPADAPAQVAVRPAAAELLAAVDLHSDVDASRRSRA